MASAKTIEKLNKYYDRLSSGKAKKIKPGHVERVIEKLKSRESDLLDEIDDAKKPSKRARLENKLKATREQIERARWLLDQINGGGAD